MSSSELAVSTSSNVRALQVFERHAPSYLLMISLLEHICALYENNQEKSKQLFQGM